MIDVSHEFKMELNETERDVIFKASKHIHVYRDLSCMERGFISSQIHVAGEMRFKMSY